MCKAGRICPQTNPKRFQLYVRRVRVQAKRELKVLDQGPHPMFIMVTLFVFMLETFRAFF